MGVLGLTDEEFWDASLVDQPALAERLFDAGFTGVALDAPGVVDVDARATLPMIGARVATYADLRRVSFRHRAMLVATRLESNVTLAALAESPDRLPPERPEPPRDRPVQRGTGAVFVWSDARERLGLPWRPGTYVLRLVLEEVASAPVRVRLVRAPSHVDPQLEAHLAARRLTPYPQHVSPPPEAGRDLPSYRPSSDGPAPPAAPGVELAAPRVAVLGRPCVVRGALRLVPTRGEVVRPRPPQTEPTPPGGGWQEVGDDEATAVVRVTLLVVTEGRSVPATIELHVPCYEAIPDPAAPGEVTASFAVDLQRLAPFAGPQTCFLYALSGEHAAGPARVAMIPPEMLRGE